jgi:hypothetical protein
MSWPINPSNNAGEVKTGVIVSGQGSYLRWGTSGTTAATGIVPGTGWYAITRAAMRYKKEDLQYDNGDGVQSARVQIVHGVVWDITVRDDTRMTPPVIGTKISITDIGGLIYTLTVTTPTAGTPGTVVTMQGYVLDSSYDTAQKQPGERVLVVERITLIETNAY